MFGGKKDKSNGFANGGTTLLARSVEILGDVKFAGNLEVEGKVVGNVLADESSDARVRIMDKGVVQGEIRAPKVVINGHVTGDVYASKHLELAAHAVVNGNVHYQVIEMVKGAQVNGNLLHVNDVKVAGKAGKGGTRNNESDKKVAEKLPDDKSSAHMQPASGGAGNT